MALIQLNNQSLTSVTALGIGSDGLIQPKQLAFQVTGTDLDQAISALTLTKVQWDATPVLDTGSYWDSTNHRYTPQVAGWYMFSTAIRGAFAGIHEYIVIYITKNGTDQYYTQIQTDLDQFIGGTYAGPVVMHQMNGTTDYVEVEFFTDEATIIHDNASPNVSWFNGYLIHAT